MSTRKTSAAATPLAGKHGLVTGGGSGIGASIAHGLLAQGATVTIIGRNAHRLEHAAHSLEKLGGVFYAVADVTDANEVSAALATAQKHFGPIQILVNNAGAAESAPFLKTTAALWRRMMAVNVEGVVHCTQAALPAMLESGWGRIFNIASVAGLKGYRYVSAYCAAKHAVVGLTRSLAAELAQKNVTVNAVCPGYTATEMVEKAVANISTKTGHTREQALQEIVAQNPQQRLIQPEEVANVVTWLCLPASEGITGQAIAVSGGEV
jgi:NAD(P)-dependent dehydrogenase (short-subunit alcohol dehydrogenase family)